MDHMSWLILCSDKIVLYLFTTSWETVVYNPYSQGKVMKKLARISAKE